VCKDTEALATLQSTTVFNSNSKQVCLESTTNAGKLFASMTEVERLFQIAGTAELKAQLPYAVRVRGAWSRGRVDERNVIDEPGC